MGLTGSQVGHISFWRFHRFLYFDEKGTGEGIFFSLSLHDLLKMWCLENLRPLDHEEVQGKPKALRTSKLKGGDTWVSWDVFRPLTKSTQASRTPRHLTTRVASYLLSGQVNRVCVCEIPVRVLPVDLTRNEWESESVYVYDSPLCLKINVLNIMVESVMNLCGFLVHLWLWLSGSSIVHQASVYSHWLITQGSRNDRSKA